MKLCVFPNDPIKAYYEKGEIKSRYFNPMNLFDEIHVISPTDDEVDEKNVNELAGNAIMKFHTIGNLNLLNYKSKLSIVRKIIKKINPDVIRSYNPLMQGWLAVKIAKELNIPCIVSIHNNYDRDNRELFFKSKKYVKYLKFWYTAKSIEPFVIKNATKIICAYRFLVPYAKRYGAKNISVIYNRIDLSRFSPEGESQYKFDIPTIIYVARLSPEKNHECLIKAIKDLDVKLLLVGDGQCYQEILKLLKKTRTEDKVIFIKSVPNEEISKYYRSADLFAAPIKQGGISIPMLESMACGVPVLSTERGNDEKEDIDEAMYFTKNQPKFFKEAIIRLISNKEQLKIMREKGLEIVQNVKGEVIEEKEADIYLKIITKN